MSKLRPAEEIAREMALHQSIATEALALLANVAKPTVPDVLPLARAYYAKPGNGAGGSLHILLDDGNVTDGDVDFCEGRAREKGDDDGIALAEVLRRMSKTQRAKIARLADELEAIVRDAGEQR